MSILRTTIEDANLCKMITKQVTTSHKKITHMLEDYLKYLLKLVHFQQLTYFEEISTSAI